MSEVSIIQGWVEEILQQEQLAELFVVELTLSGPRSHQKLRLFLDGDQGVTIDQCATVSRKLAARLDEEDLIKEAYQLEVSSAGIDQPLKMLRQYKKNIGRQVKVLKKDGSEERGKLKSVNDAGITIEIAKKKEVTDSTVLFENIQHTKVLVTF